LTYTPCSKEVVCQAHIDNLVNSQRILIIPSLAHYYFLYDPDSHYAV